MGKELTPAKKAKKTPAKTARDDAALDARLLASVGIKSVAEIAKEEGVAPHEVRARVNTLLESIDVLTIQQQRTKLLIGLRGVVAKAEKRLSDIGDAVDDREYAAVLNALTGAVRVQLQELARMEKADDSKVEALNNLRVRELLKLLDSVVVTSVREIADTYELDESDILEVFQNRLVEAAAEMDME